MPNCVDPNQMKEQSDLGLRYSVCLHLSVPVISSFLVFDHWESFANLCSQTLDVCMHIIEIQ